MTAWGGWTLTGLPRDSRILSDPPHRESEPSEQEPVTARTVPAQSGAPCPPLHRYEETDANADSERVLAHRWGFDTQPWEELS